MIAIHENCDSEDEDKYELTDESDGTRRLIELAPILLEEDNEHVYIIDEMDRCMHTDITGSIIREFVKKCKNKQLIITTHEKSLLSDYDSFKDGELWFVDRDKEKTSSSFGSSLLSSYKDKQMPEYSPRESSFDEGSVGGRPSFT